MASGPKWKRNMRRRARRMLPQIIQRCGKQCWWCHADLYLLSDFKPEEITRRTDEAAYVRQGEAEHRFLLLTVDHVKPVAPGANEIDNLVPSCGKCNRDRNATPHGKSDEERAICPYCGGRKSRGRTRCGDCRRRAAEEYCRSKGLPLPWEAKEA